MFCRASLKTSLRLTVFCSLLASAPLSTAQTPREITLIAPGGIRAAIERLLPGFERTTGYHVKATFGSGLGTKKQVTAGEPFDVPVLQPPYPEALASGHLMAGTETTLASVSVGLAVKKGAATPDISTPEALKRVLLAARSIAFPDPAGGAAAGVSFERTLQLLGLADELESRLRRASGGAGAMAMTARGDAEIGITFLSEMEETGIGVAGPLPVAVSAPTVLNAFVSTDAHDPAAARLLIEYLTSAEAARVYTELGMVPGRPR